ncbi:2-dehydropantoate 2-reductase [Cupriavidus numazuensis]|uniref:2-dehydropantoate 2-reductase n=1 Tax=Cupriavidus numazuensis TaxID=221992 RepID=A0ABN7Q598_9BURK|nr:2-dehydropantoate 2-reductase [Cupriavidus numazuensis]CAG2153157.1 hypothetical protein LMG26411_04342 [Cupriavidus numazuensis]
MKTTIYGAGAIGGWIGARLLRQGCDVTFVARGATLQRLRDKGLTLKQGQDVFSLPVHATDNPASLGQQDLVVVSVKAPALPDIAEALRPLLGPHTTVLTAMNGVPWWFFDGFGESMSGTRLRTVDPESRIAKAIPAELVIGGVVHASCILEAPGVVRQHFGNDMIIGEPRGGISERVEGLAAILNRAGIEAKISAQIQRDVWFKLWGNMTTNPISALTGATTDRIVDDPLVMDFATRAMLEAKQIGEAFGLPISQAPADRHRLTRTLGAAKTSMLQDVEAGKPIELDAILGAVQELGQLTRVPTPSINALLGLTRLKARVSGLY